MVSQLRRVSPQIPALLRIALPVISFLLLFAASSSAQAPARHMVGFEKEPAEKAFRSIGSLYKVRFFYAGSVIDKNALISMPRAGRTLAEVLGYLETGYRYAFRQENSMISVGLKRTADLAPVYAERIVKGRVGLFDGDNIVYNPGVTVRENGTTNAAITDDRGYFSLRLSTAAGRITISCVGYETNEQEVSGNTMVNTTLKQSAQHIPEVVISTGYQSLARKNTTGAYSSISGKEIERRSSQSLDQILEGAIPGLTLAPRYVGTSSQPRRQEGIDLQVRGGSAVQTNRNEPLIVVDGFPVNQLPDNMNDVEKIDVLKDAAASAIWGARASNGVIVISTKRGKGGKMKISYANNTYFTQRPDYSKLFRAHAADVVKYDKEAYDNGFIMPLIFEGSATGYSPSFDLLFKLDKGLITDQEYARGQDSLGAISNAGQVKDLLLRTGIRQNHYLSFSGGGERYRYIISGSYENNRSSYVGDRDERIQLSSRSDLELTRDLRLSLDINANLQNGNAGPYLNDRIQDLPPYQLLLDGQGRYLYDYNNFNPVENARLMKLGYLNNGLNLLEEARLANNKTSTFGLRTKAGVQWKIVKDLTFNMDFLFDRMKACGKNIISKDSYDNRSYINQYATINGPDVVFNLPKGNMLDQAEMTNNNWALRPQLNYTNVFRSVHFVNFVVGGEMKKYIKEGFKARKFGYDDDLLAWQQFDQRLLAVGGLTWWNGRAVPRLEAISLDGFTYDDIREQSVYATGAYTYDDRYTVTASYRVDQSNLFGADPKYKRTPLWSAGLAWDAAREQFFNIEGINLLKVRVTAGLTGYYDRTTTPLLVGVRRAQAALADFSARVSSYNPKLRWERTRTLNAGVDVGVLNSRIQVSADVYKRFGYDLLGTVVLDPTVGFTNMNINAAKMTNTGVEMAVQANVIEARKFRWTARLNAAYNKNKITDNRIPDGSPMINRVTGTTQYVEGYQRESLWSYRWAGLDERGNPLVYGDKDEKVKVAALSSLVNSGSYRAPYSGGFTNILYYKAFFASVFTTFNFGNVMRREMPDMNGYAWGSNYNYQVAQRWRKPGDEAVTDIAALTRSTDPTDFYDGRERAIKYSTNSVMPGDYVRLREIQLGYRLPASLLKRTPLQNVSLIAQMNNAALWKKNKYGIDPDAMDPLGGTHYLPAPRVTTLTLKVDL